jgi:hypothetical protein
MADITNNDDYIDVRDVIARFEALETELSDACEGEGNGTDLETWLAAMAANDDGTLQEGATEFLAFRALLEELKGNGGDEEWRGDWYPGTLIRDSEFDNAMDELLQDIGVLPKDLPGYLTIAVDYDALQMDYTSCEFDGVTYWYR